MVEKVKEIRVSIDGLIVVVRHSNYGYSDEGSSAIKALNLGKMWLGKALGELGEINPYPESKNPQSDKIEPTADVSDGHPVWGDIDMSNPVALLKKIRSEIGRLENDLSQLFSVNNTSTDLGQFANQSRLSLIEANMWLGMQLGSIRSRNEQISGRKSIDAKLAYGRYVEAIKSREAPGNVYETWENLSPMQQEAWMASIYPEDGNIGTMTGAGIKNNG